MLQSGMDQLRAPDGQILGVILAGGLGRRMGGRDKALVPLAGQPLAGHVAERLGPQLPPGRLLLNASDPDGRFARIGPPVIADQGAGRPGPLAGLLAAMRAAQTLRPPASWVLSAPTDTPFLPGDLVARLTAEAKSGNLDIVLAASAAGLCQVCGLWAVDLTKDLADTLANGQNKVLSFVERHRWTKVEFPSVPIGTGFADPFFNINTPGDLDRAMQLLGSEPE